MENRIQLAKQITGIVPELMELLCRKQASAQRKPTTAGAREREIAMRQKRPREPIREWKIYWEKQITWHFRAGEKSSEEIQCSTL
jgi:hypothetical protein